MKQTVSPVFEIEREEANNFDIESCEPISNLPKSRAKLLSNLIRISCFLTALLMSLRFIRRVMAGQCEEDNKNFVKTLNCNPFAKEHGLPYEGITVLFVPLILSIVFKEIGCVTITLSYLSAFISTFYCIINLNARTFTFTYVIHIILILYMTVENRRQVLISFRLQSQLEVHILAQERQSEEQASELRHMIANV
eukprot:gene18411-25949_t